MGYSPSSRDDDADSLSAYQASNFDPTYNDRRDFDRPPTVAPNDFADDLIAGENELTADEADAAVPPSQDAAARPTGGQAPPALPSFDPQPTWRAVIDELELSLDPHVYRLFVRDTWVIAYEDGEFIIGVPSAYAQDWVESKLASTIKRKLTSHMKRTSVQLTFRVQASKVTAAADELESTPLFQAAHNDDAPHPDVSVSAVNNRVRQTSDAAAVNGHSTAPLGLQPRSAPSLSASSLDVGPQSSPPALRSRYSSQLKPEYTFGTFVVGDHNRLAHAAGSAVAQQPGQRYNPFFIYGGVGLGKTHLLHAIGNQAQARGDVVLYCSSEQFTNELIGAIGKRTTGEFREKYRQVDVLLIDDIQFLSGKERTQEEFFHTFNHLHAAGGQVVLTSDRQPKALGGLEERLRSRFEGGLQADILPPDFETRVAILTQKAGQLNIPIEHEALMFVAERVDSNIRELEGALNHLHLQSQMINSPLSYSLAVQMMDNLAPQRKPCHPAGVVRIVALHHNLTPEDLIGSVRSQPIAHARQLAMYLLRTENELSYAQIGRELGGRDHSTIRYGVEKVAKNVAANSAKGETLRTEIAKLRDRIYMPYIN